MNKSIFIAIAVLLIVSVGIGVIYQSSLRESTVNINTQNIAISGTYGTEISLKDILEVELSHNIPQTGTRIKGYGISGIRKGLYNIEKYGTALLCVHSAEGPFILIHTSDEIVILNFKDPKRTQNKYDEIVAALQ